MIEFFVLFLDSLPTVNVLHTPGKSIYLSMPPSAHSMKEQHQHFFSDQRSESVFQHIFFSSSYFVVTGSVKPLLLTASVTCLFGVHPQA